MTDEEKLKYYNKVFEVIGGATFFYLGYLFAFRQIIPMKYSFIYDGFDFSNVLYAILFIILFLVLLGMKEKKSTVFPWKWYNPSKKGSVYLLIPCATLLIASLAIPIYFTGGSESSCFSPMLVTLASLIVIFARSDEVRIIFGVVCIGIYIVMSKACGFHAIIECTDIDTFTNITTNFSDSNIVSIFTIVAVVISTATAMTLQWRAKQYWASQQ